MSKYQCRVAVSAPVLDIEFNFEWNFGYFEFHKMKRAELNKIYEETPERIKLQKVNTYSDLDGINQRIILMQDDCETPTEFFFCTKCPQSSMSRFIKAAKNNCRYSLTSHLATHKKVSN